MTLTPQENADLTKVGPATPCGAMMRRYWHPVGFTAELKGKPVRRRLLGEDLVLFRDEYGALGLIGARCPHRGTSLHLGYIEDGGLRCCYHRWLFDVNGRCLEQPTEPPQANCKLRKLYKDSMDIIAAGGDPIGTIRDAAKNRMVEIIPGEFKIG